MTYYLWAAALISALFGLLLLTASERTLKAVNALANRLVFDLEGKLGRGRAGFFAGALFWLVGIWVMHVSLLVTREWPFFFLGLGIFTLGLCYAFYPRLMEKVSALCAQEMLAFDDLVMFSRRSLGLVLIMVALYIVFKLYLIGGAGG